MKLKFTESKLIEKLPKLKPSFKEWGELGFEIVKVGLISDIGQLFIGEYSHKNYIRYPHQIDAAGRVLRVMQGKGVLADEVGLGKTIEAGLILKQLFHDKLISKVLIIVPASLTSQWQYQMFDIFDFKFINASWQKSEQRDDVWDFYNSKFAGFTEHPLIISSYEKAKNYAEDVKKIKWDLIICDEAHRMRNRKYTFRLIKELDPRYLLFLTATPIHNKLEDFYNLVDLVRPGLFGTFSNFKREFYADSSGRKLKNREEFETMKNQVIVRQRGIDVNLPIPQRVVTSLVTEASEEETQFHKAVDEYIRERAKFIKEQLEEKQRWAEQFELINLGMRSNSSPKAIRETLNRKLEKSATLGSQVEKRLRNLLELASQIENPSKTEELVRVINDHGKDKILIYIIYEDTQKYLANVLRKMKISFLPFGGYMKSKERTATIREFNENPKVQILLSTDAGSEGLNLQHQCHVIINFDLPWNPMKMEQRIGRLHRIGQKYKVLVYNLAVRGSIDERIVKRLYEKIGITKRAIGEIEPILTELEERTKIQDEILEIISEARSPEDLEVKIKALEESIVEGEKLAKQKRLFSQEIFDRFTK